MLESKPGAIAWGFQPETFADAPPDFVIGEMGELVARVLNGA